MLEKLFAEINRGGTFETRALAARLGTSPEMVEAMLEHLQRQGCTQAYQPASGACGGCSLKSLCRTPSGGNSPRLWRLG